MLRAGEYSPNNPLLRGERHTGDALVGLGEYERRRNTLRKLRQQQYREYLDQQAKKKQEAKEQAERERREREERERQREEEEERDRQREEQERERIEQERSSTERRRASMCYVPSVASTHTYTNKVDMGVQVDGISRPLSVAVQTDDVELFRLSPSPSKTQLTEAERELSPHTVVEPHEKKPWGSENVGKWKVEDRDQRRRSYGDFDERSSTLLKKTNRDKLVSDLRHTYMPSIFDADAIQLRNLQAEKDAATRRQYYQQELKNQILEQQRIREERKAREKMLEQAEMRRLEEQLRMLRVAQETEMGKQHVITNAIKENATDYEKKRTALQKEIDLEHQSMLRATSQPSRVIPKRSTHTSHSDTVQNPSKLPFYYPRVHERTNEINNQVRKPPYSTNIPDNSIFSTNYDVDTYLRRNLNPSKESLLANKFGTLSSSHREISTNNNDDTENDDYDANVFGNDEKNVIVERALVHERPKKKIENKTKYEPSCLKDKDVDETLPIPVLRHSPNRQASLDENSGANLSEAMKVVDDKWKVPAVQKNILKSLPNNEGKNVSILTQLGSIRRQLQLEQLKLDKMLYKGNDV